MHKAEKKQNNWSLFCGVYNHDDVIRQEFKYMLFTYMREVTMFTITF